MEKRNLTLCKRYQCWDFGNPMKQCTYITCHKRQRCIVGRFERKCLYWYVAYGYQSFWPSFRLNYLPMRFLDCLVCCKLCKLRCWLAVGRLSVTCRPTVDRQSADRFFGELFFTITKNRSSLENIQAILKPTSKLCSMHVCLRFSVKFISLNGFKIL